MVSQFMGYKQDLETASDRADKFDRPDLRMSVTKTCLCRASLDVLVSAPQTDAVAQLIAMIPEHITAYEWYPSE